jgi:peptidoglycan-N-acetylglucosamine deacetylase
MSLYSQACDLFFGPCIHQLPGNKRYITFDDGPFPGCTENVLKTLEENKVKASFFVVAERARRERSLLFEIQSQGHSIGNHSLDHSYGNFFARKSSLKEWIKRSEGILEDLGVEPVGFRSPVGIRTPALHAALRELKLPLIHWNIRFYDTKREWAKSKALSSWKKTGPGSIVLLHDTHTGEKGARFLESLSAYLKMAYNENIPLDCLPKREVLRELCYSREITFSSQSLQRHSDTRFQD